ncbi:hypothetical protein QA634_30170 [Methylobacterium sp. CB376]|uniref:hypothetical protein n=1 Tax=unclassified Methylobacterium TaxID=2615210 RepID=UPI0002EE4934|nr:MULTISPECIES: hypothetical protein [Methylobacterium]WFT79432.1 hypothetical protein QA634_30170 [Methylobacterium nodulans]
MNDAVPAPNVDQPEMVSPAKVGALSLPSPSALAPAAALAAVSTARPVAVASAISAAAGPASALPLARL